MIILLFDFTHICRWVVSFRNVRTKALKEIRLQWKGSCRFSHLTDILKEKNKNRFYMGKNKVMQIALGLTPESSYKENIFRLSQVKNNTVTGTMNLLFQRLTGQVALMFSNVPKGHLTELMSKVVQPEFAKAGSIACKTVKLQAGVLPLQFTMEPVLRKMGLPVRLKEGVSSRGECC